MSEVTILSVLFVNACSLVSGVKLSRVSGGGGWGREDPAFSASVVFVVAVYAFKEYSLIQLSSLSDVEYMVVAVSMFVVWWRLYLYEKKLDVVLYAVFFVMYSLAIAWNGESVAVVVMLSLVSLVVFVVRHRKEFNAEEFR